MSRFLKDLESKAKSAINATPLGQYVPGLEGSQGGSSGSRSHTFDAIQHQIRSLQVQYGSSGGKDVRQLQLIITGQKGVILDLDRQAQDVQAVSKEYYLWGQSEDSDIRDVTDRLAYLTFVQGSLAASLASSLDAARAPLKALRDAEAAMQPKRSTRQGYELQISRLKNENKPGTGAKIKELEMMLDRENRQLEPHEKEIELLKRKAIVDGEKSKWDAIREYGEKLVLLAEASKPLLEVLPSVPPTTSHPYLGSTSTAATRATLQKALDSWKPGNTKLPIPTSADNETRSFGETHASELSRISSVADRRSPSPRKASPPPGNKETPSGASVSSASASPVNPTALNNAPAPIPSSHSPSPIPATAATEPLSAISTSSMPIPIAAPTIAETGVPVVAGKEGPGPSSGSLANPIHRGSTSSQAPPQPGYGEAVPAYGVDVPKYGLNESTGAMPVVHENAEDEKRRLQREERERILSSGGTVPGYGYGASQTAGPSKSQQYETAEEEKKRLEREERERVLASQASESQVHHPTHQGTLDSEIPDEGNVPPPYEEPKFD